MSPCLLERKPRHVLGASSVKAPLFPWQSPTPSPCQPARNTGCAVRKSWPCPRFLPPRSSRRQANAHLLCTGTRGTYCVTQRLIMELLQFRSPVPLFTSVQGVVTARLLSWCLESPSRQAARLPVAYHIFKGSNLLLGFGSQHLLH